MTRSENIKTATPVKPQPHRFRVSVPVADDAVYQWMLLQDNQSLSVRMLIRESIERNGYVDVINKPVAQLPKRGRPVGADDASQTELADEGQQEQRESEPTSAPVAPAPVATPQAPAIEPIGSPDPIEDEQPEPPSLAKLHAPAPEQVPDEVSSDPEPPSGQMYEPNDIFAMTRH